MERTLLEYSNTTVSRLATNTKANNLEELIDFLIRYEPTVYTILSKKELERWLKVHKELGTLMVIRSKLDGKLISLARWNWVDSITIKLLDLVIRPEYRNKRLIKNMIIEFKIQHPWAEYIIFERKKYNRAEVGYSIDRFLRLDRKEI